MFSILGATVPSSSIAAFACASGEVVGGEPGNVMAPAEAESMTVTAKVNEQVNRRKSIVSLLHRSPAEYHRPGKVNGG
jgi:hypothetical protein